MLRCRVNMAAERAEATGRYLFVLLPTFIFAAILFLAAAKWIPLFRSWYTVFGFGGTLLAAYAITRWWSMRQLLQFCESFGRAPPASFVEQAIRVGRMNLRHTLQVISGNLVRRHDAPATLFIAPDSFTLKADPFDEAFEPLHLDPFDSAFLRFCRENDCSEPKKRFEIESLSLLRHLWIAIAVVLLLAGGAGLRRMIRDAENFLHTGRVTAHLAFWIALAIAAMIGLLKRTLGRTQYFVAPAAIIVRRLSGRPKHWHVDLFTRHNAMMLLSPIDETHWYLILKKLDGHEVAKYVSQIEVIVLLRAWLSPLPPPTLDKLSDLQ